nr:flagellar basal body-associated FliL family protein [Pseudorhodobacter sp.]
MALLGLGAGIGGAMFLRPAQDGAEAEAVVSKAIPVSTEFVKLNNQFVIPIVGGGRVTSLVIMSLSVEVENGSTESIFAREPKLRDALLQVMFDHANAGGFNGVFTDGANLILLRQALLEAAQKIMGDIVKDVLIFDLSRQDN